MAAARSGAQIPAGLRTVARARVALTQIAQVRVSKSSFHSAQTKWRAGHQKIQNLVQNSRKMDSLSIRTVANVATVSSAVSNKDLIRKADEYFATDSRPIVLFDGVCNFCNAGVNFVLDNDPEGRLRLAALQSEAGRALLLRSGRLPADISSLVLVEKDRSYIKSEGVLRTAHYLGSFLPPIGSLGLLLPLFFRDFVYDNVANNRYSILGQRDQCRVSDQRFEDRFVM